MIRTYSELIKIPTFEERFKYLELNGKLGEKTFGIDRYVNQAFYHSYDWKKVRTEIITRDMGCDLACEDREIFGKILVHHMNPILIQDITDKTDILLNPEFLICTCKRTHDAIHYSDESILYQNPIERKPNDTCPWK